MTDDVYSYQALSSMLSVTSLAQSDIQDRLHSDRQVMARLVNGQLAVVHVD